MTDPYHYCLCSICGFGFRSMFPDLTTCPACQRKADNTRKRKTRPAAKPEKPRHYSSAHKITNKNLPPQRKCHDCGKPTSDYRCSECWKKYRSASFYED